LRMRSAKFLFLTFSFFSSVASAGWFSHSDKKKAAPEQDAPAIAPVSQAARDILNHARCSYADAAAITSMWDVLRYKRYSVAELRAALFSEAKTKVQKSYAAHAASLLEVLVWHGKSSAKYYAEEKIFSDINARRSQLIKAGSLKGNLACPKGAMPEKFRKAQQFGQEIVDIHSRKTAKESQPKAKVFSWWGFGLSGEIKSALKRDEVFMVLNSDRNQPGKFYFPGGSCEVLGRGQSEWEAPDTPEERVKYCDGGSIGKGQVCYYSPETNRAGATPIPSNGHYYIKYLDQSTRHSGKEHWARGETVRLANGKIRWKVTQSTPVYQLTLNIGRPEDKGNRIPANRSIETIRVHTHGINEDPKNWGSFQRTSTHGCPKLPVDCLEKFDRWARSRPWIKMNVREQ